MSCPGHPFWKVVIDLAFDRWQSDSGHCTYDAMQQTGPLLLDDAFNLVSNGTVQITDIPWLADPITFYPNADLGNAAIRGNCLPQQLETFCYDTERTNVAWKCKNRMRTCKRLESHSF
eukprot:gnl/MRDRNA2_/MRDRNA2_9914_c0_seq2.p1 gnl/MRDRNA2_/MRDRNA2_9914_c0~~gnl/MRDRNA2_/MRDRNA2_9914_c0_seq2.p1  ORF type:complete len:135 (+),score=14.39 gnl/MRDRNA2_/MRDRNA2_9914_c0_seq2:54-407(+)